MGARGSRGLAAFGLLAVLAGCQRIEAQQAPLKAAAGVPEWVVQQAAVGELSEQWGRGSCQPGGQPRSRSGGPLHSRSGGPLHSRSGGPLHSRSGGPLHSRWMSCRTAGNGDPMFLASSRPISPPVDLTGHSLRTWVRVDDLSRLAGLELRLGSGTFATGMAAFQVPLFKDPPFNMIQTGEWTPLSFSLGTARIEGKVDLRRVSRIGLYVADDGNGPLQLDWTGLTAVQRVSEGYVSFTFDDGRPCNIEIAAPAMRRHGFRGTAYVMPDEIGGRDFMTAAELDELAATYGWDVAAHHAVSFTEMSASELEPAILGVQSYLRQRGFDAGVQHLAYPLGRQDTKVVRPLVRKHFTTARLAGSGPETIPPADPHLLRTVNVLNTTTPEEIGAIARRAKEHGEWAILMFHLLNDDPKLEIAYSIDDFESALREVEKAGVTVLPVSEVWDRIGAIQTVRGAARPGPEGPPAPASASPPR